MVQKIKSWINTHVFWSVVIFLFAVIIVLSAFRLINGYETGYTFTVFVVIAVFIRYWTRRKKKFDLEQSQTSVVHPSDDYNETHTHSGKTGDI